MRGKLEINANSHGAVCAWYECEDGRIYMRLAATAFMAYRLLSEAVGAHGRTLPYEVLA